MLDNLGGCQAGQSSLWQRRRLVAAGKARRDGGSRLADEHRKVTGAGRGGQRILKRAFELPIVRVAEDVIDRRAGARAFDGHGNLQAHEFERIALSQVHAGERGPRSLSMPDLGRRGFLVFVS